MVVLRYLAAVAVVLCSVQGANIYVDTGNPYAAGKLEIGELTLTETTDNSPKHSKVYFPLEPGDYATVYFVGGLNTLVLAEYYSIVLRKIAQHGFFVFGIDYDFPLQRTKMGNKAQQGHQKGYGQDVNIYFEQLEFFKKYVKTYATPRYDRMGLLCHSSGCDITLKMIQDGRMRFNATAFLEPVSILVREKLNVTDVPGFMFGTELAEKGVTKCNIPGIDYKQFYTVWQCPRIQIEVAKYGHCEILDPVPYEVCKVTHFCTTTNANTTEMNHYRETVQGAISSFFMTMLQGRTDAISYIADESKVPLKLLIDQSDLNCLRKR